MLVLHFLLVFSRLQTVPWLLISYIVHIVASTCPYRTVISHGASHFTTDKMHVTNDKGVDPKLSSEEAAKLHYEAITRDYSVQPRLGRE